VVLYVGGEVDEEVVKRLVQAGGTWVAARNPYWDQWGVTNRGPGRLPPGLVHPHLALSRAQAVPCCRWRYSGSATCSAASTMTLRLAQPVPAYAAVGRKPSCATRSSCSEAVRVKDAALPALAEPSMLVPRNMVRFRGEVHAKELFN